jgi:histidine triad (HIT) family protein
VIPKQEVDYIFDLSDEYVAGLMLFAKRVAQSIKLVVPCNRVGLSVIGLEVPHAHIHLVPIYTTSDINFARPALSFSSEEFSTLAQKIATVFK